jgi:hypothetical protein
MFRKLREKVFGLKSNLTRVDEDQPLGKAALIIVLFLDLFVLFSVFYGLDEHTRQLASPRERVPDICRQIVIEGSWNEVSRMDDLANELDRRTGAYYYRDERTAELHPACEAVIAPIERMEKDDALTAEFQKWQRIYGESLDAKRKTSSGKALLKSIEKRMARVGKTINAHAEVQAFWTAIDSIDEQERTALREDLRRLNFWFPFQILLMQMVFLLPLFFIFYAWYSRSVRKGRGLQALIAAHLLVVTSIPIIFKVIEAVYEIIPKNILKKFIELLSSLKLVAIWHYLVIALSIVVALVLVYIFQKKLFNRTWLMEKRISKGMCQRCGKSLPGDVRACPYCGFVQFRTCPSCQGQTYVNSRHCRECGAKQGEG